MTDTLAILSTVAGVGGVNLFAQSGHLGDVSLLGIAFVFTVGGAVGLGLSLAADAGLLERREVSSDA